MPSCNTYRLTWVSLILDVGISSQLLLTLDEGYLLSTSPPDLERGIAPLGPPEPYFYLFQIIELVIYVRKIIIILHTPKTHCKNCFTVVIIDVFI